MGRKAIQCSKPFLEYTVVCYSLWHEDDILDLQVDLGRESDNVCVLVLNSLRFED